MTEGLGLAACLSPGRGVSTAASILLPVMVGELPAALAVLLVRRATGSDLGSDICLLI